MKSAPPPHQHRSGQAPRVAQRVPCDTQALAGPCPMCPSLGLSLPRTWSKGQAVGLTTAAEVVSLVQPEEAVLAGRAGLATHMGLAEALAVALEAEGEAGTKSGRVPTLCSHGPWHLCPQTHRLALGSPTQRASGITVAAWGRGRAALRVGWGAGGLDSIPTLGTVEPAHPSPASPPAH